jgi:hypothetical protein
MQTKISLLKNYIAQEKWLEALRLASRFPRLGEHKSAIIRGYEAWVHPDFYQQLGFDVSAIITEGKKALLERYGKS